MDTLTGFRSRGMAWGAVLCVLLAALTSSPAISGRDPETDRMGEVLYGEALFLARQRNYLDAITRLEMADERPLAPKQAAAVRLLLARLKLAYGMTLEAGFDFHALLDDRVSEEERNGAWHELAMAFARKGYSEAALEALNRIQGPLPDEMTGVNQLLHASLLMAMNRNAEAARSLEHWRGAGRLAAYADYNRGIALLRAGLPWQAAAALEQAIGRPAGDEEFLALRDKARLSLGYLLSTRKEYAPARDQFRAVRSDGPFANHTLLALGWIAYRQGDRESALGSWLALHDRSLEDPSVLEALLVLPAVHRELRAMHAATLGYDRAVSDYRQELNRLDTALQQLQQGDIRSLLLPTAPTAADAGSAPDGPGATRYLGALLASADFRRIAQGHEDLQAMLRSLDASLRSLENLAWTKAPATEADRGNRQASAPGTQEATTAIRHEHHGSRSAASHGATANTPKWEQERHIVEGDPRVIPPAGIPSLPEVELPDDRDLKPLPDSEFIGLPESDFSGLPPESPYRTDLETPEVIALPESPVIWLPETGRFRMPGDDARASVHPDGRPGARMRPGDRYAYVLNRLVSTDEDVGFDAGAVPVSDALRDLAASLEEADSRVNRLSAASEWTDPERQGLEGTIAGLHMRIQALKDRIRRLMTAHEHLTRSLALDVLDQRRRLLEGLLEQASLERAKTYDQLIDP